MADVDCLGGNECDSIGEADAAADLDSVPRFQDYYPPGQLLLSEMLAPKQDGHGRATHVFQLIACVRYCACAFCAIGGGSQWGASVPEP